MIGNTANEQKLYGRTWDSVHGGYFADPAIASPLVEAVLDAAFLARPSVLADLGGGTGFILEEVARGVTWSPGPGLVCVDTAREQLACCPDPISTIECSVESVEREMLLEPGGDSLMLCMRSVLHYLGKDGLSADLGHIRWVLESGEALVHQTICFRSRKEAEISNLLYDRMDTGKWYPTAGELMSALAADGLEVRDVRPAAPIPLTSAELEERYDVDHERLMEIAEEMERLRGDRLCEAYHRSRDGFTVYLDYLVMTCIAV